MKCKILAACIAMAMSASASADVVYASQVLPQEEFNWATGPDGTSSLLGQWGQVGMNGGGDAQVTNDFKYPEGTGTGSLLLTSTQGDLGKAGIAYYAPTADGFGPFSSITAASFKWRRDSISADTDMAPLMRIFLFDNSQADGSKHVATLTWTDANDGGDSTTDAWVATDVMTGTVHQTRFNGPQHDVRMKFTDAQTHAAFKDLTVAAIELGFGSGGWGPTFKGAVDDVVFKGASHQVAADFEVQDYVVTMEEPVNGSVAPLAGEYPLINGDSITFDFTPEPGFELDSVSGCDGTQSNNQFTTDTSITTSCTLSATFKPVANTVPPSPQVDSVQAVPTLSQWGIALLALMTAGAAALGLRRKS